MSEPTQNHGHPSGGPLDDAGYLRPYEEAVESHGPTFKATLWASKEKQVARFDVMAQMCDLHGRTVLDAGCGLGDLAAHLNEVGVQYGRYIGIEAIEPVVLEARQRGIPEARFEVVDFVRDSRAFSRFNDDHGLDVIVFSGSLNTLNEQLAMEVLGRSWMAAREAVVFNFLSSRHGGTRTDDTGPARRFDPLRLIDWALERTPRVLFRQDYFEGHDGTIVMLKPRRD